MKIATWNVNGIRAATKNGLDEWLSQSDYDAVCFQEIKALPEQFPEVLLDWGYHTIFPAQKKGYSGVAIFSKREPDDIWIGMEADEFDSEGRVVGHVYGDVHLISAYFPNSQRDHARLGYKLDFCQHLHQHLTSIVSSGQHVLISGDFNIAHQEIDLRNPKTNKDNAGFLPEERDWMTYFLSEDFVDVYRHFYPDKEEEYTWWSYRPGIRERNVGWRLDYFCCDRGLLPRIQQIQHLQQVKGSDHCPVEIKLEL